MFRGVVLAAVTVLVGGLAVLGVGKVLSDRCTGITEYPLIADPSIAPAVIALVDNVSAERLGCAHITVTATPSSAAPAALANPETAAALWIPASTRWMLEARRTTTVPVETVAESVAATPVVIATRPADAGDPDTWIAGLGAPGTTMADPLADPGASAAISAAVAEVEKGRSKAGELADALLPLAQASTARTTSPTAPDRLAEVVRSGGATVVTEQELVAAQAQGSDLVGTMPRSGSALLDFPLVVTEPDEQRHDAARKAGERLAAAFADNEGRLQLSVRGLRSSAGDPLDGGRGTGTVSKLWVSDRRLVDDALQQYALAARPIRALTVVDVSGSMRYAAGSGTRLDLTVEAAEAGLRMFPDNSAVGYWAFATDKGGRGQDWTELVPIRPLTDTTDGVDQRDRLLRANENLAALVGGGTGLYDTTLAAVRRVRENYDPAAVNSVIMLTDGANDDKRSITLQKLLDTLRAERDPARPIAVVTIGITENADADVLQQIADATGGSSYVARDPAEIPAVFTNALRARRN
ncbi:substrate-binding domain-containing protein [Aldersonia sp. NBC_00410]|uniref:VWA domain-containing protein n=1 Tax=Aldersonia sp. NBC_00410 TaxID=2975954 RepID=UPI00225180E3|nr:VWA domain-containing protein [Aldersonia sp. NBC_00410]MCX5045652.1 substrate-binding domain-containing protein [Aldersonia sp. NBC_00410]